MSDLGKALDEAMLKNMEAWNRDLGLMAIGLMKVEVFCKSCGAIEGDGEHLQIYVGNEGQSRPINECARCGAIDSIRARSVYSEGVSHEKGAKEW